MRYENKKRREHKALKSFIAFALVLCAVCAAISGAAEALIADRTSVFEGNETELLHINKYVSCIADTEYSKATVSLFGVVPLKEIDVDVLKDIKLYPGGMAFGVRFFTRGVLIVGMSDIEISSGTVNPAHDAGICIKDIILKVNGVEANSITEVTNAIEASDGNPVTFDIERDGVVSEVHLTPVWSDSDGKYKAGIWIRDSTAGIGTVTYVDPETGAFGGLGHGICDSDTAVLMPLKRGSVHGVTISGVVKGREGIPGELKGYFNSDRTGVLLSNTDSGVFGIFMHQMQNYASEPLPIALKKDVKEGKAVIYTTLDDRGIGKYEVKLSKIDRNTSGNKSFVVTITDPELLKATGGIVQGMSGSPVIQNGHIVGAITHVMINNPTQGYGIFIENMLIAGEGSAKYEVEG